MLNPDSPVPLYRQLADRLLAGIRNGIFVPGGKIPSETGLAAEYGIGRPTVRQATDYLVRQGILARRRGSGTFVCKKKRQEVDLFSLSGSLASFRRKGIEPRVQLLGPVARIHAPDNRDNPLQGREVFRLQRLYVVEESPVVLETLFLDAVTFHDLDHYSLDNNSLSELVRDKYYLVPAGGKQTFQIGYPDANQCVLLSIHDRKPLLLVKRTINFPNATGAVYAELLCLTDQFVFSQPLGGVNHD